MKHRKALIALALILVALASFPVARATGGESCEAWHDRYSDALIDETFGLNDRGTIAAIEAARPEGC